MKLIVTRTPHFCKYPDVVLRIKSVFVHARVVWKDLFGLMHPFSSSPMQELVYIWTTMYKDVNNMLDDSERFCAFPVFYGLCLGALHFLP